MGPEEQQLISAEAEALLFAIAPLMVILTGYGTILLGFVIAIRSLTITESLGRPQTVLLVCLVTIVLCFTWTVFDNGGGLLMTDWLIFMETLQQGIVAHVQAADKKIMIWQYLSDWPATILASLTYITHGSSSYVWYPTQLLLSDGIVVWRAVSINVADCIWSDLQFQYKAAILDWLSTILSLVVNMVATMLFAYKAWNYHRDIAGLSGSLSRKESGAMFCTIQAIYIVITVLDSYNIITSQWLLVTIEAITGVAAACYPVSVIILIHKDNTALPATYSDERHTQNEHIISTIVDSNGIVMSV
ncbi:hypothetical protein BDP27DRAFT_1425599 [Rhodocollybia butyracea]|uniref:Uncharacterized protein n=1 Tax=Rhodocollybia butyracea TaxID=206335 RepID=A0A9P5PG52_9AGAR|nr:hypothetical protein BDP27DRAFT_1425599 [Rhodocollybia butyracea]